MKKQLKNTETDQNVLEFISKVDNKVRQQDAMTLLNLMTELTGIEPKIWGVNIVGYGKYKYQRKNGDEFEWFNVGFSPGKKHLSIYVMYDINSIPELLEKLGPHSKGKGCLYIKRLEQINLDVLKEIILKSDRWNR